MFDIDGKSDTNTDIDRSILHPTGIDDNDHIEDKTRRLEDLSDSRFDSFFEKKAAVKRRDMLFYQN